MTTWKIKSRTRFGPLELGMTMDEVHSIIGVKNLQHRGSSLYPGMRQDHCFGRRVVVKYLEDMIACSIEVIRPFCAEYLSTNLTTTSMGRIQEMLAARRIPHEARDCELVLPGEGIVILANDQNREQVDSVSLLKEGLQEEEARRLRQTRDATRRDLSKRSPGVAGLREWFRDEIEKSVPRRPRETDGRSNEQE